MTQIWRRAALVVAASTAVLSLPTAASADPALSVSGIRQEAGLVEFYLSGSGLPGNSLISTQNLRVTAGEQKLTSAVVPISAGDNARAAKRAVVLVLDTSGSMKDGGAMAAAKSAAKRYLSALPADIRVGVVTAGAPATTPQPISADRTKAERAVNELVADGETALYDGIRAAGGLLSQGSFEQRRIVVLSDGEDTRSTASLAEATRAVGGIPVDTIAFKTESATTGILADLSTASGGQAYTAADSASLASAFDKAAGSFTTQVLVTAKVPSELAGRLVRLGVEVVLPDGPVRTDLTVTLVPDTRVAGPMKVEDADGLPMSLIYTFAVIVFVGLLAFGLLVFAPMMAAADRRRRLGQVDRFVRQRRGTPPPAEATSQVTQAALALSEQVMKQVNVEGRIAQQLDRAGMRLRPHEWLLIRALFCLTLTFVFAVLVNIFAAPFLGVIAGWGLTSFYHRNRATKRVTAFATLLPDALQLVVGSLRSGFSLQQAIDAMIREFPDPISGEFGRALGETRLGVDIEDALDRLATRMQSKDLAWAVVAVRVQRDVGGNLAEVLGTTISTVRERDQLRRHVLAVSADGRLSAWVLLALPILLLISLLAFRREYLQPMFDSVLGLAMGFIGLLLMAVGGFWVSKVIKVEV